MTSAALKVGDRVHVEFDGAVSRVNGAALSVQTDYEGTGGRFFSISPEWATKIADPEPEWALGDVIRVDVWGCVSIRGRDGWKCASSDAMHGHAAVSAAWYAGKVQRLVPEAQK